VATEKELMTIFESAAVANGGEHHSLLSVDSEAPVANPCDPWKQVADREGDKWRRPHGVTHDGIQSHPRWSARANVEEIP
jgi:hypothetical protein